MRWQPIATAPKDRPVMLRTVVRMSAEHARNTGIGGFIDENVGQWIYGQTWSGVLGCKPQHWREV
jgi:hypothetical protein